MPVDPRSGRRRDAGPQYPTVNRRRLWVGRSSSSTIAMAKSSIEIRLLPPPFGLSMKPPSTFYSLSRSPFFQLVIIAYLGHRFWFHLGSNAGRQKSMRAEATHGYYVWFPGFGSCCVLVGGAVESLRISCSFIELLRSLLYLRGLALERCLRTR
jgi:hypothetical protein